MMTKRKHTGLLLRTRAIIRRLHRSNKPLQLPFAMRLPIWISLAVEIRTRLLLQCQCRRPIQCITFWMRPFIHPHLDLPCWICMLPSPTAIACRVLGALPMISWECTILVHLRLQAMDRDSSSSKHLSPFRDTNSHNKPPSLCLDHQDPMPLIVLPPLLNLPTREPLVDWSGICRQ